MNQIIKSIVVASVALFFTLVAFNNLTDFESNKVLVEHVLSLESVHNSQIEWRAIENPAIHLGIYWSLILAEIVTASLCWVGSLYLYWGKNQIALIGLLLGFLIYMLGFVVAASEWFYLWQSDLSGGQIKALLYSLLLISCMNYIRKE